MFQSEQSTSIATILGIAPIAPIVHNMQMHKFLLIVYILIFINCNCPNGNTVIKVQLNHVMRAQYAGFQAARELSYYENECLNVILLNGGSYIDVATEVANGNAQFGVLLLTKLLLARNDGKPLLNILQLFSKSGLMLITRAEDQISNFQELKKKKVGVWMEDGANWSLYTALEKSGLSIDDVELHAQVSPMLLVEKNRSKALDAVSATCYNELALLLQTRKEQGPIYQLKDFTILDYSSIDTDTLEVIEIFE